MAAPTHAKDRTGPAERALPLRAPAPSAEDFASPILGLRRAAGNQAVGHLLRGSLLQPKLRIGTPGDVYEREADRVADAVLRDTGAEPVAISRAPAANLQRMCSECEEELLQRAPQEAGEEAPPTEEFTPEPAPEVAPETSPGESASEAAADQTPAAALIVEDDATEVGEGQMKKSDFLARLRPEVCAAAEAGLAGTEHEAKGCPFIDFFFGYYEGQSAERFNRDLPRFAGDGPRPATAEEYIPLIAERVRQSVTAWARTGEITGVPRGIPLPGMGLLGGVFFKALPGGPRDPGSPQALRAELGAGRPLDGGVRSRMESAFGRSFSHVRVHADGHSAGLSHRLNARAFTVGEHVAFGSQEYQPGTVLGDALLAHELAHVAQQDGASDAVQPMRADTASYGALERDADRAAVGAVASLWGLRLPGLRRPLQAAPRLSSGLRLQRCGGCSGKKAATTPAAGSSAACEPTPVSLATLQAESPFQNTEVTLGYTQINLAASQLDCTPQFAAGSAPDTCSFTPRPIHLELISKYVEAGDYPHPKGRTVKVANCGDVPMWFQLTDDIAELAKKGEQEHCADIKLAVDRTLTPCSKAVQGLAGTALAGKNGNDCLADLTQKLGFNPQSCSQEFNRLQLTTGKRDVDSGNGSWHQFDPYLHEHDCSRAVFRWRRGKKNRIGDKSVEPEVVIPQAKGCSGPAVAPPSPPTPPQPPQAGGAVQARVTALAPEESGEPSPPTEEEPAISPEEESPASEEPSSVSPVAEGEPAPVLVVDDETETVGPGQMKKSEFFARLRTEVRAAVEAGLADTEHAAQGGPLIERWLDDYEKQDTERINGDLPRFAGEGPRPATAEESIRRIAARIGTSAETWARTGEITGVLQEISLPGMDLPGLGPLGGLLGGVGGLLGGLGSVLFKARPGGARDPGDPRVLQARLGAGRPLDGSIRSRMESTFGRSFAQVRVHTDSGAAGLATSLHAKAFTVGEHVAFGAQEYRPGTMIGDALIAHELAHVAQQGDGSERFAPMDDRGAQDDALERDADRAAAGAVLSLWGGTRLEERPEPRQRSRLRLSRCECCDKERGPVIKSFDAVKRSEPQMSIWYKKCRLALGLEAGPPGMSFAPEGELPKDGCSGELQFLQLIDSCREKRTTSGSSLRRKTPGYVLDHVDPYPPPISGAGRMTPGSRIDVFTNDNPGLDTPGFDQLSIADKFEMYLLWKPDEPPGAPRVPLWMVKWSWNAKAARNGTGDDSGGCTGWTISESEALGGTGTPTDILPKPTQNAKDIPWEPGTCGGD